MAESLIAGATSDTARRLVEEALGIYRSDPSEDTRANSICAPFLPYTLTGLPPLQIVKTFVDPKKWLAQYAKEKMDPTALDAMEPIIDAGFRPPRASLRESLDDPPEPHPFRGSSPAGREYRSVLRPGAEDQEAAYLHSDADKGVRKFAKRDKLTCLQKGVSILNPTLFHQCEYLDPFLKFGGECFAISHGIQVPSKMVSPYHFADYKDSQLLRRILPDPPGGTDLHDSNTLGFLRVMPTDGSELLNYYKRTVTTFPDGIWPIMTITTVRSKGTPYDLANGFPQTPDDWNQWMNDKNKSVSMNFELNMAGISIPSTPLSLDMREMKGLPNINVGMKMILLRKVLQYSMNMDVAFVVCAEPIPTFRSDNGDATIIDRACAFYNLIWKPRMVGEWKREGSKIVLEHDGKVFSEEQTQALVLDFAYRIMLERVRHLREGNTVEIRKMVARALLFMRKSAGSVGNFENVDEKFPTELLMQLYQNVDLEDGGHRPVDPRLLFAGTLQS